MRLLLVTCLLIAAVGVALPRLLSERFVESNAISAGAAPTSPAHRSAAAAKSARASTLAEFKAERDGHFYVDAEVNGRPVHLMVDTGATVVALRQSDAQAAGIRVNRADFVHPISTANGSVDAAEAQLDSVSIRNIDVEDVRALVLPDESLSISLLGATFLNRLARFEVSNGTLTFEN
jgi:aspartyl protease family protein